MDFVTDCVEQRESNSDVGHRGRLHARVSGDRGRHIAGRFASAPGVGSDRRRARAAWSQERGVRLEFIQPGKPVQNAYVESFNGRLRDECLNANWFTSLTDARRKVETWRLDYNLVPYCPTSLCS
jgi:putative transposase